MDEGIYKRFYLTLMLYLLMKKRTIWQVSELFETTRGFLQNLLSSAISFASLLVYFTAVWFVFSSSQIDRKEEGFSLTLFSQVENVDLEKLLKIWR